MNKRLIEILGMTAFWLVTGWFIVQSFSVTGVDEVEVNGKLSVKITRNQDVQTALMIIIAVCAVLFWVCFLFLRKTLFDQNRFRFFILTLISFILAFGLEWMIFSAIGSRSKVSVVLCFGITLFYYIATLMYAMIRMVIQNDRINSMLVLEKKQSELALLRSQLQPHFLFNALNNLLAMVDQKQTPQLALTIQKLSQLLRYVIEESKNERVPISKEIEFIKSFIELNQLKYADNEVQVNFEQYGDNENQLVEPGIFISLVENAFKHGTEPEAKSSINIIFDLSRNDSIRFEIENEKKQLPIKEGTGTGLRDLKGRLEIIYAGKHSLTIEDKLNYKVSLTLTTR